MLICFQHLQWWHRSSQVTNSILPTCTRSTCIRDKVDLKASLISGQYKYKAVSYTVTVLWCRCLLSDVQRLILCVTYNHFIIHRGMQVTGLVCYLNCNYWVQHKSKLINININCSFCTGVTKHCLMHTKLKSINIFYTLFQ